MLFWSTVLYFLNKVLDIVVDYYSYLANLFLFLYKNFSFPLLFLVIIFIFREEVSSLLRRVKQINFQSNSGEISFLFHELENLKGKMENSENFQLRQYGEDLREKGHLGAGPNEYEDPDRQQRDYYFGLIHSFASIYKELGKNGPIKTIEVLYEAYTFLTKDKNLKNDEPTKIIQEVYDTVIHLKEKGAYLFDEELVYNYRSFIELSYKGLEERLSKNQTKN